MADYIDDSYKLTPPSGQGTRERIVEEALDGKPYFKAHILVETPQGFVKGFSMSHGNLYSFSTLEICMLGRIYYRRFDKCYRPRYLVTLAKEFAKEINNPA